MIKLKCENIGIETVPMYDLDWDFKELIKHVKKYGLKDGYFLTPAELEQVAREAYMRGDYDGFYGEVDSELGFKDYWQSKQKEQG